MQPVDDISQPGPVRLGDHPEDGVVQVREIGPHADRLDTGLELGRIPSRLHQWITLDSLRTNRISLARHSRSCASSPGWGPWAGARGWAPGSVGG